MTDKNFFQTIDWYNENAQAFATAVNKSVATKELAQFLELIPKTDLVLDAGCGSGRDCNYISSQGYRCEGVDLSEGLLKIARESYPSIHFQIGDLRKLPFPDSTFGGVWANASLLHLEKTSDVKKALSEFNRLLKPDGILFVRVKAQLGEQQIEKVTVKKLSSVSRLFRYYTKQELEKLVSDAGFAILKSDQKDESKFHPTDRSGVEWIRIMAQKS